MCRHLATFSAHLATPCTCTIYAAISLLLGAADRLFYVCNRADGLPPEVCLDVPLLPACLSFLFACHSGGAWWTMSGLLCAPDRCCSCICECCGVPVMCSTAFAGPVRFLPVGPGAPL